MPHHTNGLPKLDLEPFDPTPLWDAVHRHEPAAATRSRLRRLRILVTVGAVAAVAALGALLAAVL